MALNAFPIVFTPSRFESHFPFPNVMKNAFLFFTLLASELYFLITSTYAKVVELITRYALDVWFFESWICIKYVPDQAEGRRSFDGPDQGYYLSLGIHGWSWMCSVWLKIYFCLDFTFWSSFYTNLFTSMMGWFLSIRSICPFPIGRWRDGLFPFEFDARDRFGPVGAKTGSWFRLFLMSGASKGCCSSPQRTR